MQIEKQNRNLGTVCSDTSGTDCSDSMVPITTLRVVPIQRYRQLMALKGKHLGMFGSYTPGEPLFATAEEVLGYREGLA